MNVEFWRGRRVLVTGHTGFKGAWLSQVLLGAGAELTGIALEPDTEPNLFSLLDIRREIDHRIADIRDPRVLDDVIARVNPEFVFHLAAQSLVRAGYDRPVETFATNIMGTVHLLEALRRARQSPVTIVVTSDKCYRNDGQARGYVEDDPLGGTDPYSSSKAGAELVTNAYRASYPSTMPWVATARAGNVIGGGDWSENRLVPDVVRAALAKEDPVLRYPHAVRPWQHVLEPLAGYISLAERMTSDTAYSSAWNFGPSAEQHVTVGGLTEALLIALGRPPEWKRSEEQHPHEASMLSIDASKARTVLGWEPRLDENQTVEWTASWYRKWHDGEDPRHVTIAQIEEYFG